MTRFADSAALAVALVLFQSCEPCGKTTRADDVTVSCEAARDSAAFNGENDGRGCYGPEVSIKDWTPEYSTVQAECHIHPRRYRQIYDRCYMAAYEEAYWAVAPADCDMGEFIFITNF